LDVATVKDFAEEVGEHVNDLVQHNLLGGGPSSWAGEW
jgi:hypothetical protein